MGRTIHPLPMSHPRRIGVRGFGRGRGWGWMCGATVRGGVAFAPLSLLSGSTHFSDRQEALVVVDQVTEAEVGE
jgi:hypothetical protein